MSENARPAPDAFRFSLGGVSAISSFIVAPAIPDNRINDAIAKRLRRPQEDQPDTASELGGVLRRLWPFGRRRAT